MVPLVQFHYPPEIISRICSYVYSACLPPQESCLDPLLTIEIGSPTSLPSTCPPGNWSEPASRRTLASLCMVNHAWYGGAKPWLWHKLEVRLPRSWLSLVDEIAWDYDEETVDQVMEKTVRAAAQAALASAASRGVPDPTDSAQKLEATILHSISIPDESIPLELLSPVASRDPSPKRFRPKSKSPARWEIMRTISDALQNVLQRRDPGVYVPTPQDPRPGRFVHHLDFNHFRAIGMRRSVDEGVNSRFVTGNRVEAVLKEMPNLETFGATEYMDGSLTLPVLNELFLRGFPSRGRGRPSRGRSLVDNKDTEQEDQDRRRQCKDLEAVDLTGCVSAVFVNALSDFVSTHILPPDYTTTDDDDDDPPSRRLRSVAEEPLTFPGLLRLGLRGVKSIVPRILTPFVLAFPFLTHLDLSGTRATPELLDLLGESSTVRLKSLALARCVRLTGEAIRDFLVNSPVTGQLTELNLYADQTFVSPLSAEDIKTIFTAAPCFQRGQLVYLDMSGTPLDRDLLVESTPMFPKLRSLGLSHIPDLPIGAVVSFVKTKALNLEVLTLISTSPELDCGLRPGNPNQGSVRRSSITLHDQVIRPLCTPPFSFSITSPGASKPPPTQLRVLELSTPLLGGLGAGAGNWRIIRSKGGRGWYVDTASGWVTTPGEDGSTLRRDLPTGHPLRVELEKLSDANGNVGSGIGWHARKMEILHGYGLLGREDGLYGAVSFAYQG